MVKVIREMGKERAIKYLRIKPLSIFALVLIILYYPIILLLRKMLHVESTSIMYGILSFTVFVLFVAGYLYVTISIIRQQCYYYETGRNYGKDHAKYKRFYHDLVEVFSDLKEKKIDIESLPSMTWHDSSGIVYGHIGDKLISYEPDGNGTIATCWGTPGVGKTKSFIIPTARQFGMDNNTQKQNGAVMVLDLKGDIYEANKDYRTIKRFSTIDPLHSYHYDPLITARDMPEEELAEFLDNLAITLIPDSNNAGNGDSAYFNKTARGFFTAIFLFLLNEDPDISFPEICQQIVISSFSDWGSKIEQSGYLPAMKYSNRYKDENERNVGGGYSNLCEHLLIYTSSTLSQLLVNDENCISPNDLENCIDIYLQVHPNTLDIYAPLVALLFQVFMSAALHREEGANPPLCYIIDEFGQLPMMPVIQKSAMLMRAYNSSIVLSTQSIASIDQHYGENGRKILMDCCKTHVFLSVNDPDTRKWASGQIGTQKTLIVSNSLTQSKNDTSGQSVSEARINIIEPEEFSLLPDKHEAIIWQNGHHIKADTCYYLS